MWNRNQLLERLQAARIRMAPSGEGLGVIVVHLDNFGSIMERNGFDSANAVLAEVARALVSSLRPSDVVGRSGLEEFVILLLGCGREEVRQTAERLRVYLSSTPVTTPYGTFSLPQAWGSWRVRQTQRYTRPP